MNTTQANIIGKSSFTREPGAVPRSAVTPASPVSRRGFLKVIGGVGAGLTLAHFTRGTRAYADSTTTNPTSNPASAPAIAGMPSTAPTATDFSPSAFLHIDAAGMVTVTISKSEMGQGVRTSLAMMVAEELDADWNRVRVTQALGAGRVYGSMMTVGSGSIRGMLMPMRRVGAAARYMLVQVAAGQWGVDASTCATASGKVFHAPTGRSAGYGDLVTAAALLKPPSDSQLKLKRRADFKIIGKPATRVDNPDVVVGAARYAMDVKVDGMLYAVISRKPTFGATLAGFDDTAARKIPGVVDCIRVNSGVAVVARNTWAAMKGAQALKMNWAAGAGANLNSRGIRASLVAAVRPHPDMPAGSTVVEATYDFPYLAHCTMEPLNAVADARDGRCTIWAGSQAPDRLQSSAAQMLGISPDNVTVNSMLLGGGFGRRSGADYVMEAVAISQQAKAPVELIWTREDDLHNDTYRTTSFHSFRGAVGADGGAVGWSQQAATAGGPGGRGGRGAGMPYNIPGASLAIQTIRTPIPTGYWRSVAESQFCPANECFIDELAHAAGKDPLDFRKNLLRESRLVNCLQTAAKAGNWGSALPAASGRGIACFAGLGSFAAHVAEVSVSAGKFRVNRVVCVCDCGQVINPTTVEAQMQGACVDALATALKAAITIDKGTVVQNSWPDYQWMYMADMPGIEVVIIDSAESSGGVGELGYPSVMPAVANALFAATGKRVRKFPIQLTEMV